MIKSLRYLRAAVPALALACTACSTAYTPKRADRAYLVVSTAKLAVSKNGQTVAEDGAFSTLLTCDEGARNMANAAHTRIANGRSLATAAAMLNILVGPGNLVAIPLLFMAQDDINTGHAGMVDAINMHNDAESCRTTLAATK